MATATQPASANSVEDRRSVRYVLVLSWVSLLWMTAEGVLGLWAGYAAGSVALVGWAFGSVIEGFASVIVIWRFTGSRRMSETAERQAQRGVAVSFYVLAAYIVVEALRSLTSGEHPQHSTVGIVITALSVIVMPALGFTKRSLGKRLASGATSGEGTQNLLCAAQAGAVLVGLAVNAAFGAWWADPVIALLLSVWAIREGRESWRGADCC